MSVNARPEGIGGAPRRPDEPDPAEPHDLATPHELWYLECLKILSRHLRRPPNINELCLYCKRSNPSVYDALCRLESKGYVTRAGTTNSRVDRRFVPVQR